MEVANQSESVRHISRIEFIMVFPVCFLLSWYRLRQMVFGLETSLRPEKVVNIVYQNQHRDQ